MNEGEKAGWWAVTYRLLVHIAFWFAIARIFIYFGAKLWTC